VAAHLQEHPQDMPHMLMFGGVMRLFVQQDNQVSVGRLR
jgi:hypothetical protein